jgi:Domain of unknown function (DUF4440)
MIGLNSRMVKNILPAFSFLIGALFTAVAQTPDAQNRQSAAAESRELFDTIARVDAKMFEAFNGHNPDVLMSMFTDDLEFYHDKGGLTNYQQTAENFKNSSRAHPTLEEI